MSTMTRTVKIFGSPVTLTIHVPTNEEYNAYSDSIMQCESDKDLLALRLRTFDAWVESAEGIAKEAILDRVKSSVIYQLFEKVEIAEKN